MTTSGSEPARQRSLHLARLVRDCLPRTADVHGPHDAWPLVAPGLLAWCAGTVEAIVALMPLEREVDASILLRSLYEHVVAFAWLAIEPSAERLALWRKHDCSQRIKADNDCRALGEEMLSPTLRADCERTLLRVPGKMPSGHAGRPGRSALARAPPWTRRTPRAQVVPWAVCRRIQAAKRVGPPLHDGPKCGLRRSVGVEKTCSHGSG